VPNVSSAASVRPKTAPLLSFFTLQIMNAARVPVASVSLTKAEPANRARARGAGRVIAAAYRLCGLSKRKSPTCHFGFAPHALLPRRATHRCT
jgi:hypothetical protein